MLLLSSVTRTCFSFSVIVLFLKFLVLQIVDLVSLVKDLLPIFDRLVKVWIRLTYQIDSTNLLRA